MTLKEKIQDVDIGKGMSDRLEKIADEYAIGFAKFYYVEKIEETKDTYKATEELLKIYKKENNL